jgi:hypothetical protein
MVTRNPILLSHVGENLREAFPQDEVMNLPCLQAGAGPPQVLPPVGWGALDGGEGIRECGSSRGLQSPRFRSNQA